MLYKCTISAPSKDFYNITLKISGNVAKSGAKMLE
jgi:hypothetical protein